MLDSKTILIVEENGYRALDLASVIEDQHGRVAGPVATAAEAIAILDTENIAAAMVDCELCNGDSAAIIALLSQRGLPVVIQTSGSHSNGPDGLDGRVAVLLKPVDPRRVVDCLLLELAKADPA